MALDILHYEAGGAGVIFPTKTFIIEEENSFVIISPSQLDIQTLEKFKTTKKKLIFIAPNNFHTLHLKAMYEQFPEGDFFGPHRAAKVSGVKLKNTKDFSSPSVETLFIQGNPALGETCFFYKPDRTLIVTDLFFNMNHEMNFMTKITMKMAGTYKRIATSRIIKFSTKDKSLFRESLKKLSQLDFDTVIPSHGDSISKDLFVRSLLNK